MVHTYEIYIRLNFDDAYKIITDEGETFGKRNYKIKHDKVGVQNINLYKSLFSYIYYLKIWIVNTYLDKFYKVDCRNSAGVK